MPKIIKLGSTDDHLITLPIPVGGGKVVEVTMPTMDWMDPDVVDSYNEFVADITKRAAEFDEWQDAVAAHAKAVAEFEKDPENSPKPGRKPAAKPPHDPEELNVSPKTFQLRWLKHFCSDAEWEQVQRIPSGLANEIFQAINGAGEEITEGESSGSADS